MTITLTMDNKKLFTIPQVEQFTLAAQAVEFSGAPRKEKYAWVESTLRRLRYRTLRKKDRSSVKQFIMKTAGYSDIQTERLIGQ